MWHGMLFHIALFVLAVYWCIYIIRRLPDDLRELRRLYVQYRTCRDPAVLATMESAERRRNYQQDCAREFWTTLGIQLFLFWPLTALALLYGAFLLWGAIGSIRSAIG